MSSVRLRRLQADYEKLRDYAKRHPRVRLIQAEGEPPELYQLQFSIRSVRQLDSKVKIVKSHTVEIALPRNYPRVAPHCRMLTPVFHPNIAPHAICVGDHWSAGEALSSLVVRIGEMLAYQSYNTQSPLNGEAAKWADENSESLPLDSVSMLVEERRSAPQQQPVRRRASSGRKAESTDRHAESSSPQAEAALRCPSCNAGYRIPPQTNAKRFRCKRCQTIIELDKAT